MNIDIEKLRKQAGIAKYTTGFTCWEGQLERFAELVAAKEREACAKICDEYSATGKIEEFDRGWLACAKNIATAIRAIGEQA